MDSGIKTVGSQTQTIANSRRAVLEARLNLAIKRAQKQYQLVEKTVEPPNVSVLSHLGSKIDVRV